MYISLYGKLFIVGKQRNGKQYLSEVKLPHDDNYKYMTVESCIQSNEEHGISYVCNGDFHSLSIQ